MKSSCFAVVFWLSVIVPAWAAIAWKLQPRLTALDIGELLREALFQRFGHQLPSAKGLEFLTDNGPEC